MLTNVKDTTGSGKDSTNTPENSGTGSCRKRYQYCGSGGGKASGAASLAD
jgi:hypothetical protein